MKISPVVPGAINPLPPSTGLPPEKIERLKSIARGETPQESLPQDRQVQRAQDSINKIKMRVNRTTNKPVEQANEPVIEEAAQQVTLESPPEIVPEAPVANAENAISDADVQAKPVTEDTRPISPQLAELARQRRALQVKERELADKEKALLQQSPSNDLNDLIARFKSQPLSVLQEYGVTYDQLTEAILANQSGNSEVRALEAKIQALEKGFDEKLSQRDVESERAILSQMRRNVDSAVQEGDAFEMIRETGSQQDVVDLIHNHWKKTGEVMTEQEAMELVENDLVTEAQKIAKLKKVMGSIAPAPQAEIQPQVQKAMRTLTSRDSARPTMSARERAIAAAEGRLKR